MALRTDVALPSGTDLSQFRWRDSGGGMHTPQDMETRHLWFTVRMVWNHAMPEDGRLTPYRRHRFGPYYTPAYMADAVRALLRELLRRDDLEKEWRLGLAHMVQYLFTQTGEEMAMLPKETKRLENLR